MNIKILEENCVRIEIRDRGCGIPDVGTARQPLYTTDSSGERSGMGFTVMEGFSDKVKIRSEPGKGTSITLIRKLQGKSSS
jgi:stage II sporulation protein AB (anti-sigma F factor)